jgi:hypothetical protein
MHAFLARIKNDPVGSAPPVQRGLTLVKHAVTTVVCNTVFDHSEGIEVIRKNELFKTSGPNGHA